MKKNQKFYVEDCKGQLVPANTVEAVEAMKELVAWVPEGGFPGVAGADAPERDCPFFSEAFLYELFGKSDARGLLGRLNTVVIALGFNNWRDLR